ncbi:hypothetical protein KCU68_g1162, partial [Aureobasidium melanogenum]
MAATVPSGKREFIRSPNPVLTLIIIRSNSSRRKSSHLTIWRHSLTNNPCRHAGHSNKAVVPSKISYLSPRSENDAAETTRTKIQIGSRIQPGDENCLYYLKLLLAKDALAEEAPTKNGNGMEVDKESTGLSQLLQGQAELFSRLEATLQQAGVTVTNAIGHFFHELREGLLEQLKQTYGLQPSEAQFEFVFTVPATWPDTAVDRTLEAAKQARLEPVLRTISEPEAAVHCIADEKCSKGLLTSQQVCITIDAGGGTIDVISYTVKMIGDELEMREAAMGQSQYGGGASIDASLLDLVKQKLENHTEILSDVHNEHNINQRLQEIKENFDVKTTDDQKVHVGLNKEVFLKPHEIRAVFDNQVAIIKSLVSEQRKLLSKLGETPYMLFLSGGLGSNRYIQAALIAEYGKMTKHVLNSETPQHAVAQGAVLAGVKLLTMKSRKSRHRVGMCTRASLLKGNRGRQTIDLDDPVLGPMRHSIRWFLEIRDDLPTEGVSHHFDISFWRDNPLSTSQEIFFVTNKDKIPPKNKEEAQARGSKIYRATMDLTKYDEHCIYHDSNKTKGVLEIQARVRHDGARFHFEFLINNEIITVITQKYPTLDERILDIDAVPASTPTEAIARLLDADREEVVSSPTTSDVVSESAEATAKTQSAASVAVQQLQHMKRKRHEGGSGDASHMTKRSRLASKESGQEPEQRTDTGGGDSDDASTEVEPTADSQSSAEKTSSESFAVRPTRQANVEGRAVTTPIIRSGAGNEEASPHIRNANAPGTPMSTIQDNSTISSAPRSAWPHYPAPSGWHRYLRDQEFSFADDLLWTAAQGADPELEMSSGPEESYFSRSAYRR